jgi:hypothetical protein
MSIAVYMDESGTHDITGQEKGSEVAVICGYAGWKANWGRFTHEWEYALKLNRVPYFHYRELEDSKWHPEKDSCYKGWSKRRKDAFVLNLAKIASKHASFPVGGNFNTEGNQEQNLQQGKPTAYPYKRCFDQFFISVREELERCRPGCTEKITFFFDRNQDPRWQNALQNSYDEFRRIDSRFVADVVYGDKKVLIPLQAADLLAYATRKVAVKAYAEGKSQPMNPLLRVLHRKMPNSKPGLQWT